MTRRFILPFVAAASVASGCNVGSEEFLTKDLDLNVEVLAEQDGTTVTVSLFSWDSPLTPVELSGTDKLVIQAGDQVQTYPTGIGTLEIDGGSSDLVARFGPVPAGSEIQVSLVREKDTSATGNRVTIPDGFEITAPSEGGQVSIGPGSLQVEWNPPSSEATTQYTLEGSCVGPVAGGVERGARGVAVPLEGGVGCNARVQVERAREADVDPALHGGGMIAVLRRSVDVRIVP